MQCRSGNLVLVEVVLDMDEGFLAVAVDVEYVSVEDANLILPAVLDGVAVDGETGALELAARAEEERLSLQGPRVDGLAAEDVLAVDEAGRALRPDGAEVARDLRFIGCDQAVAEGDLHRAVADVAARFLVVLHGARRYGGAFVLQERADGMHFRDIRYGGERAVPGKPSEVASKN